MVDFISERWRVRRGGNPGYNEVIDYIAQDLRDGGFESVGRVEIMVRPLTLHPLAWDPIEPSLSIVEPENRLLHTYADTPTLIRKFSGHSGWRRDRQTRGCGSW